MDKAAFFKELDEILEDQLFIGESPDDLHDELAHNTWSISVGQEMANELTIDELKDFIDRVQINRKEQIMKQSDHNMIFYAWFDRQSARLRFSLISDFHEKLPFAGAYRIIDNVEPILDDMLQFPYHGGLPIMAVDEEEEEEAAMEPFDVYSVIIANR